MPTNSHQRRLRDALAEAHAQNRELRNQLDSAAQPLRIKLREAESTTAKLELEMKRLADRVRYVERQNRVQRELIDSLIAYEHQRSTGKIE